jgi:hypothetical protein
MTLTEAAFWTKRVGIIVLVLVGIFVIVAIITVNNANDPLPPEFLTATYACTDKKEDFLAEKLEIPSLEVNSDSENVFELQTDSGKVNDLSFLRIVNVHKYKTKNQQLDNQIKAKELAKKLGFEPDEIYRKGTTDYIWTNKSNSRSLDIDAKTLNFIMTTDSAYIRDVGKEVAIPSENEAISLAKNTIRQLGVLGSDYNFDKAKHTITHLIDINPDGTYSEAPSLAEAELIKVDFHKDTSLISIKDSIDNSQAMITMLNNRVGEGTEEMVIINDERVKVFNYSKLVTYTNPNTSHVSVYIGPEDPNSKLLSNVYKIEFTYWPIETESCGTYEIVSPSYALEKVQDGEGSLVYLNEKMGDEIEPYQPRSVKKYTVYDIFITYFEPESQVNFLQPIYVISGESTFKDGSTGEFIIYYPAINYDIVQDKVILPEEPEDNTESNGLSL